MKAIHSDTKRIANLQNKTTFLKLFLQISEELISDGGPVMEKPAPRLPLKLPIEFRKNYSRKSDYGDLKNISLTGAFLIHETDEIVINDRINIHFKVSGRERVLQASVVWLSENGCGLQFHPDNNRDVQIVDDLMYFVKDRREKNRSVLDTIFTRVS